MIAARLAEMEDVWLSMQKLGMFIATVSIGLIIHTMVVLPIVYFAVTRKNPYVFIKGLRDALMTAFGIASRLVMFAFRWTNEQTRKLLAVLS